MKYITFEIQNNNGAVGTLVNDFDDRNQAESKYHTILASAAISAVPIHSAMLMTDEGFLLESKCYKHEAQAQAEEE